MKQRRPLMPIHRGERVGVSYTDSMLAVQLLWVLILLTLCSFAPGFFFVRRLRWSALEKLCGSIGLSLILLYLAIWTVFVLGSGSPTPYYFVISGLCVAAAISARHDLARLLRAQQVRYGLIGFGFLLLWTLLIVVMIRNYSGAGWGGDWQEHFQRSLFFLHRFPSQTLIRNSYLLPSRPPLMNVLAAFFLGQTTDRFEIFQIVFLFLNLLLFLPCFLMLPALALQRIGYNKSITVILVAIFAMNPMMMENAAYPWTKEMTAFFVVLGLWFYLAAIRKSDSIRMVAAFLALAAGLLAHYSAGPYVVAVTLHYLFVAFRKQAEKFKELAAIAILCSLLLLTWFGWSFKTYGLQTTFASNTSVTSAEKYQGSNLQKIDANLIDTILPGIVRDPSSMHTFDQPNRVGFIRDNVFILYQVNLILAMGITGGIVILWMLDQVLARSENRRRERIFWLILVIGAIVLGTAVVGERDLFGIAHLTLLPLEALGLTWLASIFSSSRIFAYIILAGLLIDFPLGVFLQARVQNLDNSSQHTYFTGITNTGGQLALGQKGAESLTVSAWGNWVQKHKVTLCREWLAQLRSEGSDGHADAQTLAQVRTRVQSMLDEDASCWQGWYTRHGGSISFLGDFFGSAWIPAAVLLILWLALLVVLWNQLPPQNVAEVTLAGGRAGILCGALLTGCAVCFVWQTASYLLSSRLVAGVATMLLAAATTFSAGFVISHLFSEG